MNHNWYAVITANVLMARDLSSTQKLLIALISNLSNERGYCFAGNDYMAECLNVKSGTISDAVSELESKGYIGRTLYRNELKQIESRVLVVIECPEITPDLSGNNRIPPRKNPDTPILKKPEENNKVFNNKENSIYIDLALPENKINSAIEYLSITKRVEATKELVLSLWTFFKQKNFTGRENDSKYSTENRVYSHFLETLKFEKINGTHQQSTAKSRISKSTGAHKLVDILRDEHNAQRSG